MSTSNAQALLELQNFRLKVDNFPIRFSNFQAGPETKEYVFGSVLFVTRHPIGVTHFLLWSIFLVGIKGMKKLALKLYLHSPVPNEKLGYTYHITSSLKRLYTGFSARSIYRFDENHLQNFKMWQPIKCWRIDDNFNLFEEWGNQRLGNIADFIHAQSGMFEMNLSIQVTEGAPLLVPGVQKMQFIGGITYELANNEPYNLEFRTADGVLRAQKHYFAAKSPYIARLIREKLILDNQVCTITFPSTSTRAMEHVVMYLYRGKFSTGWEPMVNEIMGICISLELQELFGFLCKSCKICKVLRPKLRAA